MIILGIDEVGRGCWAGPLVVGAVILGKDIQIDGLTDSKLLTKTKREELAEIIQAKAEFVGLGWVEAYEIDEFGLTKSMMLGIKRAIKDAPAVDKIIIDGPINYLSMYKERPCTVRAMVRADQTVPAVSAASIVAKVARDNYMASLASNLPKYGFESHVGYGTKAHQEALAIYGPSQVHRLSFKPVMVANGAA
jgi:ribonuclease HII